MNRIALGTAQFGLDYGIANQQGQLTLAAAKAVLDYAREQKIDTLDTAIAYGNSESRLGKIGIQGMHVISKLPAIPVACADINHWIEDSIVQALERLGLQTMEGLLLHNPQDLLGNKGEELFKGLQRIKGSKLVDKIGISIYSTDELEVLLKYYEFDIVQAPFNLLDHRLIESDWINQLDQQGIELHVRSIFLQGLLLMSPQQRPEKFKFWQNIWNIWDDWLKQNQLTAVQACLRYVMSFPQIKRVIVGVDTQQQLFEILQAMEGDIAEIPNLLKQTELDLVNPSRWSALIR